MNNRHHYEIVCEHTGQTTRFYEIESSKRAQTQLIAALDLCDGQETELLLCYNRMYSFGPLFCFIGGHHCAIILFYWWSPL